jgi:hypothetical protein
VEAGYFTPASASTPYSPECVDGKFSEVRLQDAA